MVEASTPNESLRFPVSLLEYPGKQTEIVVNDDSVLLLIYNWRPGTGLPLAEIRLLLTDYVGQQGQRLQFCSRYGSEPWSVSSSSVDFAGLGGNAWFHLTCDDETSAGIIAERIGHLLESRRNPLLNYFRTLLPE